jgi:CubicO group peptidase (beta-lactamase class C family)
LRGGEGICILVRIQIARAAASPLEASVNVPPIILLGLLAVGTPQAPATVSPLRSDNQVASQDGPVRGPSDPAEIGAFLDGLVSAFMLDHHVAGITVSVVRDGALLFSRGYGYAVVDSSKAVDPATTLFRIGSISKLFTWTAVMQQVEEGKLDLDTDVNEYLDFQIPATFPEPITLRDIMTHTPGFEDRGFGLFGETDLSRGEWLRRNMPARVRPPGTYSSYSNYATSLAGYIVERVSGQPWEDYIEEHIIRPLGMVYATGRQPLSEDLAPYMSQGYVYQGGEYVAKPFEMIEANAPAGAVSASADAMAKFMIAHLQYGTLGDQRILREETSQLMQTRQFGHDPRLNGFALGFYEQSSHGLRIIGHGGDTGWFHSNLSLIPADGVGVFMSTNTTGGGEISFGPFLEELLDHYYPTPPPSYATPPENWAEEAAKYAGTYQFNRHSYTTFEKVVGLAGGTVGIRPGAPGELVVSSPLGSFRALEVEPGLFSDPAGSTDLSFEESDDGTVTRLFLGLAPMMAGDKLSFWQQPTVHQLILGLCLILLVSPLLLMPIRYLMQRSVDGVEPLRGRERGLRWLAFALTLLIVAFLVGLGAVAGSQTSIIEGHRGPLEAVLTLPVLMVLVVLAVVAGGIVAWRSKLWGRWGRVHFNLFALAAVVFLLELNYWNLLGWKI